MPLRPDRRRSLRPAAADPFLPLARAGVRPGLARIRRLLAALGHPERRFATLLVAGSNGKGTAAAGLESIFRAAGFRTGLFTSPHLVSVSERFRVEGRAADLRELAAFMRRHGELLERLGASYFEATTACALWLFARRKVEWGILEIGLGGRWDACNAVTPAGALITSISREHTEYLGRRLDVIAREKAQVARGGRPAVVGAVRPAVHRALRDELRRIGARAVWAGEDFSLSDVRLTTRGSSGTLADEAGALRLHTPLRGAAALSNLALAAETFGVLARGGTPAMGARDTAQAIRRGIRSVHWPGRLHVLRRRPLVVADVAHNAAAVHLLCADWRRLWPGKRPVVVVGLLGDKSAVPIGRDLGALASTLIVTTAASSRAVPPGRLARLWRGSARSLRVEPEVETAVREAVSAAGPAGAVLVCGSHYVVGPALRAFGAA